MNKVKLILLAAPSGAGKNSFLARVLSDLPILMDIVTYTTRKIRDHEMDGKDYNFVDEETFQRMVRDGDFAEWAKVHKSHYGTSRKSLEGCWAENRVGIMDIDIQGVRHMKELYPDAVSIFLLPPSIDELKRRILSRDKDPPGDLDLRMETAKKEIAEAPNFDLRFVNDDFERSYGEFKKRVEELLQNGLV